MPKYTVIGVTMTSCVIKPAFPCKNQDTDRDRDYLKNRITKITDLNHLKEELSHYELMPDIPDAPYLKASDITLCKLCPSHKEIFEKLNKRFDIFDENYFDYDSSWQIQMPYLGVDLLKYLEQFTSPLHSPKIERVMTVIEMKNLYTLLVIAHNSIYNTIKLLNGKKIYHNDIKLNNILYNQELNKLYLIDFGISKNRESNYSDYLHFTTEIDYENTDISLFLTKVIRPFLYYCIGNSYIYEHIKLLVEELEQISIFELNMNKFIPYPHEKYTPLNIQKIIVEPFLDKLTSAIVSLDDNATNIFVLKDKHGSLPNKKNNHSW